MMCRDVAALVIQVILIQFMNVVLKEEGE